MGATPGPQLLPGFTAGESRGHLGLAVTAMHSACPNQSCSLFPSSTWKELPILLPILLAQHGSLFCSARLLSSSSNPPHRSAPCVISSDDSWPLLTSPEAPKGRHLS